jgi:hypothetical protein
VAKKTRLVIFVPLSHIANGFGRIFEQNAADALDNNHLPARSYVPKQRIRCQEHRRNGYASTCKIRNYEKSVSFLACVYGFGTGKGGKKQATDAVAREAISPSGAV